MEINRLQLDLLRRLHAIEASRSQIPDAPERPVR